MSRAGRGARARAVRQYCRAKRVARCDALTFASDRPLDGVAQALGDLGEEDVAAVVAERVVDLLEVVEIDEEDGHLLPVGRVEHRVERLGETVAVGQRGDRIRACLRAEQSMVATHGDRRVVDGAGERLHLGHGARHLDDLDLNPLLVQAEAGDLPSYCTLLGRNEVPETLDAQIIADAKPLFEDGEKMQLQYSIRNTHRAIGTKLSSMITRRFGMAGLAEASADLANARSARAQAEATLAQRQAEVGSLRQRLGTEELP